MKKGSIGRFEYWLVGKMNWEVRSNGHTLARCQNMNEASRRAQFFYDLEQTGDVWGVLASAELAARPVQN